MSNEQLLYESHDEEVSNEQLLYACREYNRKYYQVIFRCISNYSLLVENILR